jgi:hypothetical protein
MLAQRLAATRNSFVKQAGILAHRSRFLSATPPRPFKILGLQQIAIGGEDKGKLVNLWQVVEILMPAMCSKTLDHFDSQNLLGVPKTGTFKSVKENVDEDILKVLCSCRE